MNSYMILSIVCLFPVILAVAFRELDKHTKFNKLKYAYKQIIIGVLFGGLAILGTEFGIPINGAQINCRDASVMTAGLLFGAPAGIIAGIIGGVERYVAVYWGVGAFTQIACSVSTIIAGFYSAFLRKFLFENKRPGVLLSFAIGVVMEVFHLTMVFFTNMSTPQQAMTVVRACTVPMVIANAVSLMLAAFCMSTLNYFSEDKVVRKKHTVHISQTIQRWLLVAVAFAFLATSVFVYSFQDRIAMTQAENLLNLAVDEISADINDASDKNLLAIARAVNEDTKIDNEHLSEIALKYDVCDINLVNSSGIIVKSCDPEVIGFDMGSGEQSGEFLCLLGDKEEYVQKYGPISRDPKIMRKYAGIKTDYGFLQVGYNAEQFQKDISSQVEGISKNRHVGETGFILVLDVNLGIVSAPDNLSVSEIEQEKLAQANIKEGERFSVEINNDDSYALYKVTEGFIILSCLPKSEALQMRNIALYVNTFMEILVFAILFGLIYLLIKKVVVNKINEINGSLGKITGGNLDVTVNVRSNAEFASLSDDINSTVETLKNYIAEASSRIDKELEFAKNIQSSALPTLTPAILSRKEFDIYASMYTAKEVGGDFYDFYITNEKILNFLVADVSGKGIPAAMFMMRAKTELRSLTENNIPLNEVFTNGNNALCDGNDAGMFVTVWQGNINLENGVGSFVNAGHNMPLIKRANGKFEFLKSRAGFVMAGMEGVNYKSNELQLNPGDTLFLYTDGVTEATNSNNELYGDDRLLNFVNNCKYKNMTELCGLVKADIDKFVGEAPQFDDITMLAFCYKGEKKNMQTITIDNACIDDITKVTEFVESELSKIDCPMKALMQINVAIDEIFSNIVRYGYADKKGTVVIKLDIEEGSASVQFIDEGIKYNPLEKDDPDTTLSAEERGIGGLGIFMVKKTMDSVDYDYLDGKNILTINKKF